MDNFNNTMYILIGVVSVIGGIRFILIKGVTYGIYVPMGSASYLLGGAFIIFGVWLIYSGYKFFTNR